MTVYGHTSKGVPIDDAMIAKIAAEAEAGFPGWRLQAGRPAVASGRHASKTRGVRFPPALEAEADAKARAEGITFSDMVRKAVAMYVRQPA